MITGIDHLTSGQVVVNGVDIYEMNESQRALWRGKNLGIVFQFFQLLPMLTLLENVMLPMDYVGMYDFDERPKRAMELLAMVGLEKQADKLPAAVSTGQQQSAAIARRAGQPGRPETPGWGDGSGKRHRIHPVRPVLTQGFYGSTEKIGCTRGDRFVHGRGPTASWTNF
jgi:hypothetical protein